MMRGNNASLADMVSYQPTGKYSGATLSSKEGKSLWLCVLKGYENEVKKKYTLYVELV